MVDDKLEFLGRIKDLVGTESSSASQRQSEDGCNKVDIPVDGDFL